MIMDPEDSSMSTSSFPRDLTASSSFNSTNSSRSRTSPSSSSLSCSSTVPPSTSCNPATHPCSNMSTCITSIPLIMLSIMIVMVGIIVPIDCQTSPIHLLGSSQGAGSSPNRGIFTFNEVTSDLIEQEPTYFVLASKIIRPGQVYRVIATVYRSNLPITVRAAIQRNGVELASTSQECKARMPETLLLRVPSTSLPGQYRLRVEGNLNGVLGGTAFLNETELDFSQRSMTIFITTDKPVYMQEQTVRFRCLPITTDLKAFTEAVDVYMLDPKGNVMRRWLSRQSNFGAVSLEYHLSQLPMQGNWTIRVIAQGQEERKNFLVEEYYQTRFEVNVSMPTFFLDTEEYVYGSIMANFTSGIAVTGNVTILTTIEPANRSIGRMVETYPALELPVQKFDGYTEFKIPMTSLSNLIGGASLDGAKVSVKAYIGERFLNLIYPGFARAYIFGSRIKLSFLGSSPQVFKPSMPFKAYCAISYHDGSPLTDKHPHSKYLDITPKISFSGRVQSLTTQREAMSPIYPGIWEITVDLRQHFKDKRILADVQKIRIEASFTETGITGERATAVLDVYSYYTQSNRLIQVSTSTKQPRVGEYVIFHVRANYFVETFSYVILSKGMILLTGREDMSSSIKTFAVSLSPEMAPSSTIVIYDIAKGGDVTVDSLTFPVDGISRNNFTVTLNGRKDKSGDTIEVVVLGQPGTYIGLSAMDKDLYAIDNGNQINHADVLRKMSTFDQQSNGTLAHVWISREGDQDEFLHFASPSFGIDANRTFGYSGLVVFSDGNITRRREVCNNTQGFQSCFDGRQCYHNTRRCDGRMDCQDGTDESNCPRKDPYNLDEFRVHRSNRLQRLYENSWLWKDINIGPLGYYIFNAHVPNSPASWTVSAFGMSVTHGFGLQSANIQYSSVRPFYINVEMPSICNLGEQVSVRVSVFNNLPIEIEVVTILARSADYKFVQVGPLGKVSSYAPQTSFGEHHHLIIIRPGRSAIVYLPIVATRLGNINVTIMAKTQIAKDVVTKTLRVEPDGIPQHMHTSVVLDLSQGAYLIKYLDTNITDTPIIPFREERRYIFGSNKATISVMGDVVGPAFPSMPVNASSILRKPSDSGEQNMFNFAINMYTLFYLRMTGQRNNQLEKQAFKYLNIQYQSQLSYQNPDGSFRAFRYNQRPSVWLTAFVTRILYKATFQEWENFLFIDPNVISKGISFILQHQNPDGAFYETAINPYDRKMNLSSKIGDDNVKFRNISLTAHVLITLTEVKDLRGEINGRVATAKKSAQKYLERMLHVVKLYDDPYDLCILTYALTLANSVEAEEAFNIMDSKMREVSGMRYWSKQTVFPVKTLIENNRPYILPRLPDLYESLNVETTAYALLVHLSKQAVIQQEIVEWLNTHRLNVAGWSSTQDTVIAFQALIEYSIQSRLRDVTDIQISLEVPSTLGFEKKVHVGQHNLATLQSYEVENAYGPIIVKAQGSGSAIVSLDVSYNVDWAHLQIQPPVKAFDLNVQMHPYGRNHSHITFSSCQRWNLRSESFASGQAVLEVTIPTGYLIQQQELDTYVKSGAVRNLQEARYQEKKVTFYFDYLDDHPICIMFTVQRWYPVANLTRYMPVRIYDYYAPERFNETMVNAYSLYVLSVCHVCGSYQCPYCPIFSGVSFIAPSMPLLIFLSTVIILFSPNSYSPF